jgi:integrase/recombinase XerD
MNLDNLVTQYVAFRRTLGERFQVTEAILRRFCRAMGPEKRLAGIRMKEVTTFLTNKGNVTRNWHCKYCALKGFFRFALGRGHLNRIPLPPVLPKWPSPFVPYIYTRDDLRRLFDAIPSYRRHDALPPFRRIPPRLEQSTFRAILLLLYGAGLRVSEALRLKLADVNLANALITIHDTKFFKSRLVPISRSLTDVLSDYARWRTKTHPSTDVNSHFFVDRRGAAISLYRLEKDFGRLRKHAGVRRSEGSRYHPRLHDLRHTFAVNRLTAWYRQGADVQRLVHHLCVYLGHVGLASTQVYLTMTTELLQQASRRFERYARKEDSHA